MIGCLMCRQPAMLQAMRAEHRLWYSRLGPCRESLHLMSLTVCARNKQHAERSADQLTRPQSSIRRSSYCSNPWPLAKRFGFLMTRAPGDRIRFGCETAGAAGTGGGDEMATSGTKPSSSHSLSPNKPSSGRVKTDVSGFLLTSVYRALAIVASGVFPWQFISSFSSATLHAHDNLFTGLTLCLPGQPSVFDLAMGKLWHVVLLMWQRVVGAETNVSLSSINAPPVEGNLLFIVMLKTSVLSAK